MQSVYSTAPANQRREQNIFAKWAMASSPLSAWSLRKEYIWLKHVYEHMECITLYCISLQCSTAPTFAYFFTLPVRVCASYLGGGVKKKKSASQQTSGWTLSLIILIMFTVADNFAERGKDDHHPFYSSSLLFIVFFFFFFFFFFVIIFSVVRLTLKYFKTNP